MNKIHYRDIIIILYITIKVLRDLDRPFHLYNL